MPRVTVAPSALSVMSGVLAAAVATAGTLTVGYPLLQPGTLNPQVKNKGSFFGVGGHKLVVGQSLYSYPNDFEITLGTPAAGITVTNRSAATWPAGAAFRLQMNEMGSIIRASGGQLFPGNVTPIVGGADATGMSLINLGAPLALSATAVCAAQAIAGAANAVINGVNAVSGVAYLDVARAVRVVSAGAGDTTQTVTVYGTDIYGQPMRENIALNGTTVVPGKKAFFTVNRVAVSGVMAGNLSVGSTDVLGLPVLLTAAGYIVKELQDGAAPTAGTTVAGIATIPTATTGDVRGTYTPNAATDGTKALQLLVFVANPGDIGAVPFNG